MSISLAELSPSHLYGELLSHLSQKSLLSTTGSLGVGHVHTHELMGETPLDAELLAAAIMAAHASFRETKISTDSIQLSLSAKQVGLKLMFVLRVHYALFNTGAI